MTQQQNIKDLIVSIAEAHKDAIWTTNVKTATNIDEFEQWCDMMAKIHSAITLQYMFNEDEFEQEWNKIKDETESTTEPAADSLD
jgi:hypothetical protein